MSKVLKVEDVERIRVITLNRPEALNAFNEALYDSTAEALIDAANAPSVAVVVCTGSGRAFSAGTDVVEMAARAGDPEGFVGGKHGFPGLIDQLTDFPKPLLCAVNGLALGIGVTLLGYADLVFMSSEARIRCPFTDLAVAPEAASSYLLPLLLGRQEASWVLLSSEWITADECQRIGLAWKIVEPSGLMGEAMGAARTLASKPIASLIETKRTIVAAHRDFIRAARAREDKAFLRLLGQPANIEALAALAEGRSADFAAIDAAHPVDIAIGDVQGVKNHHA
jgi:enoyl-CoA hydratase/carnithine racemase